MAKFDKKASKKGQSKKTKDAQAIQAASEVKVSERHERQGEETDIGYRATLALCSPLL